MLGNADGVKTEDTPTLLLLEESEKGKCFK